jgi:hypothetical protein
MNDKIRQGGVNRTHLKIVLLMVASGGQLLKSWQIGMNSTYFDGRR